MAGKRWLGRFVFGFQRSLINLQAHQCLCTSDLHGISCSSVPGTTVLEGEIVTTRRYEEAGQLLGVGRGQKDAKRESYVIGVMKDVKSTERM